MASSTVTGSRSNTKITKITKNSDKFLVLFFVALVIFVEASPWAVTASQGSANWPQFRRDARLSGVAAADLPATLSLKWTYEAGETIESSTAIVDGVVYAGAGDGNLLALDLATGKLRWKYATGNLLGESSPAVAGGLVYVGDLSGVFHAVNVKDGSKAWTFKTGGEIKSPPVAGGGPVLGGSDDPPLYAPGAGTGKLRGKPKTNGRAPATPRGAAATIFFGGGDEQFR